MTVWPCISFQHCGLNRYCSWDGGARYCILITHYEPGGVDWHTLWQFTITGGCYEFERPKGKLFKNTMDVFQGAALHADATGSTERPGRASKWEKCMRMSARAVQDRAFNCFMSKRYIEVQKPDFAQLRLDGLSGHLDWISANGGRYPWCTPRSKTGSHFEFLRQHFSEESIKGEKSWRQWNQTLNWAVNFEIEISSNAGMTRYTSMKKLLVANYSKRTRQHCRGPGHNWTSNYPFFLYLCCRNRGPQTEGTAGDLYWISVGDRSYRSTSKITQVPWPSMLEVSLAVDGRLYMFTSRLL